MKYFKSVFHYTLKPITKQCHNLRQFVQAIKLDHEFKDFKVQNEPALQYLRGSQERHDLEVELERMGNCETTIPIVIGGKEITTKNVGYQVMPHCHQRKIAKYYNADAKLIRMAICAALNSQVAWDLVPIKDRIEIWRKAADLLAGKYRQQLNAATMLGQGKSVQQAEIDASCELVDFMRWNAYFLNEIIKYQPQNISPKTKNTCIFRGMDGFVASISPFNFTAISGNLAYTPALCGNCVIWKPSPTAILSNWIIFQAMTEAGVPKGVVNFVPSVPSVFGDTITASPCLAAINFTGSVATFRHLWCQVGKNISNYNVFPRLIGECGGKNFHFVHPSADLCAVLTATIRSAFEYCGQKCSACSRFYVPQSIWPKIEPELIKTTEELCVGDVRCFRVFTGAVIDKIAFDKIVQYIEYAKKNPKLRIIAGGSYDDSEGYFIKPTIVVTQDPTDKLMQDEIFGPILTVYVYKDQDIDQTLKLVRETTKFALTGSVFSEDEGFICKACQELRYAAGNFYINTKSTAAVVAQQPFGGAKLSGTNDKAGGPYYVLRFLSPQVIKQDIELDRKLVYENMAK